MDHRIRNLNDVDWEAEPTHQEHVSEIDYRNSRDSFWEGGSKDTFAARIEGQVTIEEGGAYRFFTSADDGVALFIDGKPVVKDDGNHGYRTRSGEIELEPGTYDIEVRYFENYGHAGLKVEWQGPDTNGREKLQADQEISIDANGTLDVGIAMNGASESASIKLEGLPANTILTSGDDALVMDARFRRTVSRDKDHRTPVHGHAATHHLRGGYRRSRPDAQSGQTRSRRTTGDGSCRSDHALPRTPG